MEIPELDTLIYLESLMNKVYEGPYFYDQSRFPSASCAIMSDGRIGVPPIFYNLTYQLFA